MGKKLTFIESLANKLYAHINKEKLNEALEGKRPADRIGMFQDLLIDAIKKSTLCCFNGRPYYYGGRIYEQLGREGWDAFYSLVKAVADKCKMQPGDKTKLESVCKVCRREVSLKELEVDNHIIVLQNGVLDVEKGTFHKFSSRFHQITQMSFDYNPDEVPFLWKDIFLDRVLPDEGYQKVLQEFMGAIFIDRDKAKIEKMLILKGAGSNGKSVVFETLKGLLGEDNIKTIPLSELIGGSERKQNIASINGKRLNYCSEIQTQEFGKNVDALKALISGEPFEVRLVYINNFTARNIPLLMANANRMPYIKDWSHGLSRRIIILPFDVVLEEREQNKQLSAELRKEYPAILNWILAGRQRLIANNYQFSVSQKLVDTVEEYQSESSTVLAFMKAKDYHRALLEIRKEPRWLEAQQLFYAYVKWCAENEITPESQKKFSMVLAEAGFGKRRTSEGVSYAVYVTSERPIKEEFKPKNEVGEVDGMENLAHYTHVSRQTIEKMVRNGLLDHCSRKEGRRYWFDLAESRKAVKKFLKGDKRYDDGKVTEAVKAERRSFNKYMKENGEPFRKYDKPNPHAKGVIYVTDEFNYQRDKDNFEPFLKFVPKADGGFEEAPQKDILDDFELSD